MNNMSLDISSNDLQSNTAIRDALFCIYGLALIKVHDILTIRGRKITYKDLLSVCPVMSEYPSSLTKAMFIGSAKYLSNTFLKYLYEDCKLSGYDIESKVEQATKNILQNIK